jgi:hypothetical protein
MHPLIFSHKDKNKGYQFIHSKFIAKFSTLKSNSLNQVCYNILNLSYLPPYLLHVYYSFL